MSWYTDLQNAESLGSKTKRPGSLAGLHEARKEHLSQFFTPLAVTDVIWRIVNHNVVFGEYGKIRVFDNSCGNGAMFFNANPEYYNLFGCDVHEDSVNALCNKLGGAGFDYDILNCGMEDLEISGRFDLALINPPFSIHLESQTLEPYKCTSFGRFGENTSAMSHDYALEQALNHSDVVIAVLPKNQVNEIIKNGSSRLCAVYELPIDAFINQGAQVKTAVCVFSEYGNKDLIIEKLGADYKINELPDCSIRYNYSKPRINERGLSYLEPSIKTKVTGDKRVVVSHSGRKINLKFFCGFVEAKVSNAILICKAISAEKKRRLARHVKFEGQGVLDLQLHFMQADPVQSIYDNLINVINNNGGVACVDEGLLNYVKKMAKRVKRASEPFSRVVFQDSSSVGASEYKAIKDVLINEGAFVSPVVARGEIIDIKAENGRFYCDFKGKKYQLSENYIVDNFEPMGQGQKSGFVTKHEGKNLKFPELFKMYDARAKKLNLDKMLWQYQYDDLIESMVHPTGLVLGWDMSLGKTRFALAAILLSDVKHGLIIVKAGLIPEFIRQIKEDLQDYINIDDVNVINDLNGVTNLNKINIISYSKLFRSPTSNPRKSYSHLLKRRCGLVVGDEAHLLANYHTQQSKAVARLCAKKFIAMTGTAIPNYARNIHPILVAVAGDGTVYNNWGIHNGKVAAHHIHNSCDLYFGTKEFMEHYVTLEWCTYEFEDNTLGAKREIPKIKNLADYRDMLAPVFKRRVVSEPDCAKHVQLPVPDIRDIYVDWDFEHLEHYYKVCRRFADIWKNRHKDKKAIASILPRINAVLKACNRPFILDDNSCDKIGAYFSPTSKDRYCLKRIIKWVGDGKKVIYFVNSPDNVERMFNMLKEQGINAIKYTGQENINKRALALENDFKNGDINVMLATKACASEGLNIPDCSRVLIDSSWNSKIEDQAIARVLRKGQIDTVVVERVHISGSIDVYQRQMTEFKRDACNAGLDFCDPTYEDEEFLHMETIINSFVEDLDDLQKQLLQAAA